MTEDWDGGWEAHERRQRQAWLRTTPAQRMAWLESAIEFARRAGALRPAKGERVADQDGPREATSN